MVDQIIRPAALPNRANPNASEKIPVDNGANVGGATVESIVLAGRPTASQAEAEAGTDPVKAMTPLTTRQGLISQIGVTIASKAQGDLASTSVQPGDLATVATTGDYDDLINKPIIPPGLADGDKGDISVSSGGSVWKINKEFDTVADLIADVSLGYAGSGSAVSVVPGQIITAQGFRYEVAASDAEPFDKDNEPGGYHVITTGGVKLLVVDDELNAKAFGLLDTTTEQTTIVQLAFDVAHATKRPLRFNRTANKILCGESTLPPIRLILDEGFWFTSNVDLLTFSKQLFNFDGSGVWHITGYGAGIDIDKAGFSGSFNHAWSANHHPANGWNISGRIILEGIEAHNCGGDGFYFRCGDADVVVRDIVGKGNRRQGTSIVAVKSFDGSGGFMSDTSGTAPTAGVDIEPNDTEEMLGPIRWVGLKTSGNGGAGLEINLEHYWHADRALDIHIEWSSEDDNKGGGIGAGQFRRAGRASNPIAKGQIYIKPSIVNTPTSAIAIHDWSKSGPRLIIDHPFIMDGNLSASTNLQTAAAIALYNATTGSNDPGGVDIIYPRVVNSDPASTYRYVTTVTSAGTGWDDVDIWLDPADAVNLATNTRHDTPLFCTGESLRVSFNYSKPVRRPVSNITLSDGTYLGMIMNNSSATGARTITLPAATANNVGQSWEVEVRNAYSVELKPAGTDAIVPIGTSGKGVISSTVGSRVKVSCYGAGVWMITDIVGTWAQGA